MLDQEILKKTSEAIEAHMDDTEFDIPELCKEIGVGRSVLIQNLSDDSAESVPCVAL